MIVDSGSSVHLVSEGDLSPSEIANKRPALDAEELTTANGKITPEFETEVYVKDLQMYATCQIVDETMPILAMGKLVSDHGFKMHWTQGGVSVSQERPEAIRVFRLS